MKTKYGYIRFDDYSNEEQKTKRFMCMNNFHGSCLGEVKWNRTWLQYCFFPASDTVWARGCLEDINDFIRQLKDEKG